MSKQLKSLMTTANINGKYTGSIWLHNVEDNIEVMQNINNAEYINVPDIERIHYKGSFFAYLRDVHSINDPIKHHMILRANNMKHPSEFGENWDVICIPSDDILNNILNEFTSFR